VKSLQFLAEVDRTFAVYGIAVCLEGHVRLLQRHHCRYRWHHASICRRRFCQSCQDGEPTHLMTCSSDVLYMTRCGPGDNLIIEIAVNLTVMINDDCAHWCSQQQLPDFDRIRPATLGVNKIPLLSVVVCP